MRGTLVALIFVSACATTGSKRHAPATKAVQAIQSADFEGALREAEAMVAADAEHPEANAIAAIARYRIAVERLVADMTAVVMTVAVGLPPNDRYLRTTLEEGERALVQVDEELARASAGELSLELCPACWEVNWNRIGGVDDRDRRLLEIETDATGAPIPEGDPRRRPTFHFDRADLDWARAMVAFQRGLIDLVLAWDSSGLAQIARMSGESGPIVIRIRDPKRLARSREMMLEAIEHSARARLGFLAETDDDREWVPNPKQQSHPLPLPVDAMLYETWEGVLGDLSRMLDGKEGLPLKEAAQLLGSEDATIPPGFVDLSKIFSSPRDLTVDPAHAGLRDVLGHAYVDSMKPTPLISRLARMKKEIDAGKETVAIKLRYLLWLN